jgi:hypothetical protein
MSSSGLREVPHRSHWSPYALGLAQLGTGAHDVAVGQELRGLLVVVLLGDFFLKDALVVEVGEEILRYLVVHRFAGAGINVEGNAELWKESRIWT